MAVTGLFLISPWVTVAQHEAGLQTEKNKDGGHRE